jgi:hypothetical protein
MFSVVSQKLFIHFVIPDLTKPAPYVIRGNPVFSVWIPAEVEIVPDMGRKWQLLDHC